VLKPPLDSFKAHETTDIVVVNDRSYLRQHQPHGKISGIFWRGCRYPVTHER
jgi:hypothetical protein